MIADMPQSPRAARLETALRTRFDPSHIEIIDESSRHAGHTGAAPDGETHFRVTIVSAAFTGLSRVARSRAVYDALADELQSGLHALALTLRAPGEYLEPN
jgi:BolA protein